jgi:hypothetical protein
MKTKPIKLNIFFFKEYAITHLLSAAKNIHSLRLSHLPWSTFLKLKATQLITTKLKISYFHM